MMKHLKLRTHKPSIRHQSFDGHDNLVVPVVALVEGVLNDAFVPQSEFARFPLAWNGVPVPVGHPSKDGVDVSANDPEVLPSCIGRFFNCHIDGNKLKGEIWVDVAKAKKLGHGDLLIRLESGTDIIDVSTAYFTEAQSIVGEHEGKPFSMVHTGIRPDHIAILPDEPGACSVEDGCGVPRSNCDSGRNDMIGSVKQALQTLANYTASLLTGQEADDMAANKDKVTSKVDKVFDVKSIDDLNKLLKANALTPRQFQQIQDMDAETRALVKALIEALEGIKDQMPDEPAEPEGEPTEGESPTAPPMPAQMEKMMTEKQVEAMIADRMDEYLKRNEVIRKLKSNERNPFSVDELNDLPLAHLEKLEKSIRPANYAGQAAPFANDDEAEPLTLNGVLGRKTKRSDTNAK